jgi:hypothetical protein
MLAGVPAAARARVSVRLAYRAAAVARALRELQNLERGIRAWLAARRGSPYECTGQTEGSALNWRVKVRQPGCLSEIRGFAAPSRGGCALIVFN